MLAKSIPRSEELEFLSSPSNGMCPEANVKVVILNLAPCGCYFLSNTDLKFLITCFV